MPGMGELGMSSGVDRASRIIQAPASPIYGYGAFADPKAMESWRSHTMRLMYEDARGGTGKSAGSATEVTVRAEDVPEGISAEEHVLGMTSTLANLAKLTE